MEAIAARLQTAAREPPSRLHQGGPVISILVGDSEPEMQTVARLIEARRTP
jgi:hypothetical protein